MPCSTLRAASKLPARKNTQPTMTATKVMSHDNALASGTGSSPCGKRRVVVCRQAWLMHEGAGCEALHLRLVPRMPVLRAGLWSAGVRLCAPFPAAWVSDSQRVSHVAEKGLDVAGTPDVIAYGRAQKVAEKAHHFMHRANLEGAIADLAGCEQYSF